MNCRLSAFFYATYIDDQSITTQHDLKKGDGNEQIV